MFNFRKGAQHNMDLITIREIYKNREQFVDKQISVEAGYAVSEILKLLDLLF